jgi:hypothetical protein
MPAITSLEDLKSAQKDFVQMFLAVFPLRLTTYGQWEMAQDRLEECLQAVVGGEKSGAIERGRWMRFLKGKISERIQLRPPDRPPDRGP